MPFQLILFLQTTILLAICTASKLHGIPNCINYSVGIQEKCLKCSKGYFLNDSFTSCEIATNSLANCLQKSMQHECMRCDCGYALDEENGQCVLASAALIGCEVFKGKTLTCTRPKPDFSIFTDATDQKTSKTTENADSIRFAKGTNCEIRDIQTNICLQCHSGFKLTAEFTCVKSTINVVNEFHSFYSSDGRLQSRHYQYIELDEKGVFLRINNCLEQQISKDGRSSQCLKCFQGKVPNERREECFKSPVFQCSLVSDSNPSLCVECEDNENFYLHYSKDYQQAYCLVRQPTDPTDMCLEYMNGMPGCKRCLKGLVPTFTGCVLEGQMVIEEARNYEGQMIENAKDVITETEQRLMRSGCLLFASIQDPSNQRNPKCQQCQSGLTINILGQCSQITIPNCLIVDLTNGCFKCVSLMYYLEPDCISISSVSLCSSSSGIENKCDLCNFNSFLNSSGQCVNAQYISNCIASFEDPTICLKCSNLFYLNDSSTKCLAISQFASCHFSDGLSDKCLICGSLHIMGNDNICQFQVLELDGLCISSEHYFDSESNQCVQISQTVKQNCFQVHKNKNECSECYSEFYLENGLCVQIKNCYLSDGITNYCYQSSNNDSYIDVFGKVQKTKENCFTNMSDKQCGYCDLIDEKSSNLIAGAVLDENSCVPQEDVPIQILYECFHLVSSLEDNGKITYRCDLCSVRFYPNEAGICQPLEDLFCDANNGRSNKCLLCSKGTYFNEQSQTCQHKSNLLYQAFCEDYASNKCNRCKNLFFLSYGQCRPILDRDCLQSNGIDNECQICSNGIELLKPFRSYSCFNYFCEKVKPGTHDCAECKEGYGLIVVKGIVFTNNTESIGNDTIEQNTFTRTICQLKIQPHCAEEDQNNSCVKCNEGFHLGHNFFQIKKCLPIKIENCLEVNNDNPLSCLRCKKGYILIINSQFCQIPVGCLRFQDEICTECEEGYEFVKSQGTSRYCVKHQDPCKKKRKDNQCELCESSYYPVENKKGALQKEDWYLSFNFQISHFEYFSYFVKNSKICVKLPNCDHSDGLSDICLKCQVGFRLQNGICVSINEGKGNCEIYSVFVGDNSACLKCQSLFFVTISGECQALNYPGHCIFSDGINDECLVCAFNGYVLRQNSGICEVLENCLLSNGIEFCVMCADGFIVDQYGRCIGFIRNIENCIEYTTARIDSLSFQPEKERNFVENRNFKQGRLKRNYNPLNPLMVRFKNFRNLRDDDIHRSVFKLRNLENTDENVSTQSVSIQCLKCESFYGLSTASPSSSCIPFPEQISKQCLISNGAEGLCSICAADFIPIKLSFNDPLYFCSQAKRFYRYQNIYCQAFDRNLYCNKCYPGFFMDNDLICHKRQPLKKCIEFHRSKDECLICRNGYTLQTQVVEGKTKKICQKLDPQKEIKNCQSYKANTNVCVKCQQRQEHLGIVEYLLDEQNNKCEYVLHWMCKLIDAKERKCLIDFIPNCEVYSEEKTNGVGTGCLRCQKGYYLEQSLDQITYVCLKHQQIENCVEYSQNQKNSCTICLDSNYLNQNKTCSFSLHSLSCRIFDERMDTCVLCNTNFVIVQASGLCIQSEIPNCLRIKILIDSFGQDHQLCLECAADFIISEDSKSCVMQIKDSNCILENENNQCVDCKTDYFLTSSGDCILSTGSLCSIQNCVRLHPRSNADDMTCESCASNYSLDADFKCSFLDPDSDMNQQDTNLQDAEQAKELKATQKNTNDNSFVLCTVIAGIAVFLIGLGVICSMIIKNKQQNMQWKQFQNGLEGFKEAEISTTEIQMGSIKQKIINSKQFQQKEQVVEEEGQQIISGSQHFQQNQDCL